MPAPHVLLNALYLAPGVSGGPETYLRGLAPALARTHPEMRLTIATTRSGAASLQADGWRELAELIAFPCEDGQRARRQISEQVLLPRAARRVGADIVHSLANLAPLRVGTRTVTTVHDVTFIVTQTFGRVSSLGMTTLVKSAVRNSDRLITATTSARDEICAVLGVEPSRFAIVPHGHEPVQAVQPTGEETLRARYGLGDATVVLCVAAKRPHKNQELLIRAAEQLEGSMTIVLVGHAEPYETQLRELTSELALQERVRFAGYVPSQDLEGLWRIAACAAFPTLKEGFGIPVIEALARGVSVAASDLPVLREVGGELPHYFDPHDPADAARAIREAAGDSTIAVQGPRRAASFTWSAAAEATYAVYEQALAGNRPR